MKTKLLFTAALMAATVGTQAVPSTGSSMLVQLLESQRLENNVEVLAEGEETSVDVPTSIASYDFQGESADVQFKRVGNGVIPYFVPLSATERGLKFTEGALYTDIGYVQVANPFYGDENIEMQGATVSLWAYLDNANARALFGFGLGQDIYEDFHNSGSFGLQTDGYMPYNVSGSYIDFRPVAANPIPQGQMSMVTMTFTSTGVSLYVNGTAVEYNGSTNVDINTVYPKMLANLKTHFTHFYIGKGGFQGTFSGRADKLGFYDHALTAEEVKALYDSQKNAYANPIDLNAKEDVTAQYIVNADFSDAEDMYKGWTNEGMPCDAERSATLGMPFMTEESGGALFDFYQVVENIPNGIYTVSAQVLTHANGVVFLYANNVRNTIAQCGTWGTENAFNHLSGWADNKKDYRSVLSNVMVTDGTLRIGVNKNNGRRGYVGFDNFRLEKASLNDMMTAYNNLKADAEALDESLLQSDLKVRLDEALADEPTDFTVDAYTEACFALQAAYDVCNYYLANCTGLTDYVATCEADIAGSTGDAAALNSAISAVEGIDWSTVTAAGLQQAYEKLVEAHRAYQSAATPVGDHQFDMTWLLTNPKSTGATTGWYCNVMGGDAGREHTNVGWSSSASYRGDADVAGFIEKWSTNIMSPGEDGNGWLLYQQALLPAGAYKLTALAFTDMPFNATTTGDNPVTGEAVANLSMGFGSTVKVDGEAFDWQEHEKYTGEVPAAENKNQLKLMTIPYFYLGEAATAENPVKLGINIKEGNKADWFGINDMKLYKVAPQAVNLTLDETSTSYSVEPNAYANVTLTRTLKSDAWNTFCVPFDMTAEQLAANGITDVRALETASVEGTSVTLNFSESSLTAVEAGVPYLVKVASYDGTINVENVLVSAAEPTTVSVEGGVSMTGNYAAGNVPTGAYFISDNAFYYADVETVVLKGFRAYINVNGTSEAAGANRLMINLDGEVTGIEDVLGEEAAEADKLVNVVSLDGMTVKAGVKKAEALDGLQKGIYIVDGKKYVVK